MFRQGGKETKRRILNGFIVKERTSRVGGSWIEMREKILTLWRKFNFHRQFFRSGVKFMPKFALLKFVIQCVAECSVEWKLFSVSDDESRKTITILLMLCRSNIVEIAKICIAKGLSLVRGFGCSITPRYTFPMLNGFRLWNKLFFLLHRLLFDEKLLEINQTFHCTRIKRIHFKSDGFWKSFNLVDKSCYNNNQRRLFFRLMIFIQRLLIHYAHQISGRIIYQSNKS